MVVTVSLQIIELLGERQLLLYGHSQQRVQRTLLCFDGSHLPLKLIQLCRILVTAWCKHRSLCRKCGHVFSKAFIFTPKTYQRVTNQTLLGVVFQLEVRQRRFCRQLVLPKNAAHCCNLLPLRCQHRAQFNQLPYNTDTNYFFDNSLNKYERYYWTWKAPVCLLTQLSHYDKPRLCITINDYAPPIGCSIMHRAAISSAAARAAVLVKVQCQGLNQ